MVPECNTHSVNVMSPVDMMSTETQSFPGEMDDQLFFLLKIKPDELTVIKKVNLRSL